MAMGRQGDRQGELMVMWSEMPRSPGHVFYDPPARGAARSRVRRLRGRSLPRVLRQDHGRALGAARPVLSHAHGRVLRGDRQRARDRVALLGLILVTRVPPPGDDRPGSGPFLAVEDAEPPAA